MYGGAEGAPAVNRAAGRGPAVGGPTGPGRPGPGGLGGGGVCAGDGGSGPGAGVGAEAAGPDGAEAAKAVPVGLDATGKASVSADGMECGRTIGGGGEKGSPTGPADSGPAVGADVTGGGSSGAEEAEKESVAPGPAGARSSGGADMSGEWSPVGVSSWVGTAAQGTESIMARSEIGGRATALVVSTVEPMSVEEPSGLRKNALSGKTRPRPRAEPLAAECWAGAAACVWCLMDWRLGAVALAARGERAGWAPAARGPRWGGWTRPGFQPCDRASPARAGRRPPSA